mmetsp:Transcript_31065/g.27474  ORF Transcript_31065/g.27474 Transcript_31065/m.27474 type:complete len:175 (+) Transcript_31065:307-831(+)
MDEGYISITTRSTTASKSSISRSTSKLNFHAKKNREARGYYDVFSYTARDCSEETIKKMKKDCEDKVKKMYSSKFKKNIKAKKIPSSHGIPFKAFLSTKTLTIGKEPSFKTVERAKQRQEYNQSLEREKSIKNQNKLLTEKKRKIRNSCDRESIDSAFTQILTSVNFDDIFNEI